MTRVALITNGIASTLHAGLGLAERLAERGDAVTFVSHADIGDRVERAGHGFVRLTADREAFDQVHALVRRVRTGSPVDRLRALARLPGAAVRGRRRTVAAEELRRVLAALSPELLVIDMEEHVAISAAVPLGTPTVLTTFLFAIEERAGVPPIDSWSRPDDPATIAAEWNRVRDDARRARRGRLRSGRLLADLFAPVSYRSTGRTAIAAVARRSGFDLRAETSTAQWLRPHGYTRLPVLSTNLRELELGDGGGANWHYVGPMIARSSGEASDARWTEWSADRDPARPLVYCTLGSYWNADMRLLRRVVEAVGRHPDWDMVIGLGGRGDPTALHDVPDRILVLDWAPQVEVLARADVAVVHGGNASLNECVTAGVPMVVCSTGHLDQNGIAVRVDHAGIGVGLDGSVADVESIDEALTRCLGDAAIGSAIGRARDLAQGDRYRHAAGEVIDSVLGRRASR